MPATPLTRSHGFHLDAPRPRVIRLFTAEGERAWAPGWSPEILSGLEERGSAFRTRNERGVETAWVVVDWRPEEGRASYARVALGSNIGLVDVACEESADGGTDVSVRYTLTGLDEAGREFVRAFLEPGNYARMIEEWRELTARALIPYVA